MAKTDEADRVKKILADGGKPNFNMAYFAALRHATDIEGYTRVIRCYAGGRAVEVSLLPPPTPRLSPSVEAFPLPGPPIGLAVPHDGMVVGHPNTLGRLRP